MRALRSAHRTGSAVTAPTGVDVGTGTGSAPTGVDVGTGTGTAPTGVNAGTSTGTAPVGYGAGPAPIANSAGTSSHGNGRDLHAATPCAGSATALHQGFSRREAGGNDALGRRGRRHL